MKDIGARVKSLGVAAVLVLLTAPSAFGQPILKANIPFEFTAAGKLLPAGEYEFIRMSGDSIIRVRAVDQGQAVLAVVMTRLAGALHSTPKDAHVVFDKVGEKYFLSELWVPGIDGFVLHITKEKHEHRVQDVPVR